MVNDKMVNKIIVAIDGYSSCGKSTIAKALAKYAGYTYVDTGAMYRAIALFTIVESRKSKVESPTLAGEDACVPESQKPAGGDACVARKRQTLQNGCIFVVTSDAAFAPLSLTPLRKFPRIYVRNFLRTTIF